MGLLGPNIQKLMDRRDVDGLRAALRNERWEVCRDAACALGWLELPPSAPERQHRVHLWYANGPLTSKYARLPEAVGRRQGIVSQAVVADLQACGGHPPLVSAATAAMARIGGPAGVEAVIRRTDEKELLCWLGWADLAAIVGDETRPVRVREAAAAALRFGTEHPSHKFPTAKFSLWSPEETARALQAAGEWDSCREWWALQEREKEEHAAAAAAERARSQKTAAAQAGAVGEERLRQLLASPEPSAEESAQVLAWIYDRSPYSGGGFVKGEAPVGRVRDVGERLDECGGFRLMREAHALFAALRPAMARNLEMVWDGIGTWSG
jgi:hypothetical protein